jgi:hypothetical protein
MPILHSGPLHRNGKGAQTYFRADFVRQFGFPLDVGDDIVAQLIPHRAVVLLPTDETLEYPFEVDHPSRIDPKVELDGLPIEPAAADLRDFEEGETG